MVVSVVSSACWFSKLGKFTAVLCVAFAWSSHDRGFFLSLHVRLTRDSKLPVGVSTCERCVQSATDWQPARGEFFSFAGRGLDKQRITDYLSLTVTGEGM